MPTTVARGHKVKGKERAKNSVACKMHNEQSTNRRIDHPSPLGGADAVAAKAVVQAWREASTAAMESV